MGGYDIFSLSYSMEGNAWKEPKNMGLPINSGRDELSFSLSADGTLGMFTTNRPESKGGYDIYLAYMKEQVIDQLMYAESVPFIRSTLETDSTATDVVLLDNSSTSENGDKETISKELKVREFLNTPLYYGKDENVLNPQNTAKLDGVFDLMVIYPDLKVTLTCHAMEEGRHEFDLYFSIKRAEKAANYLINKGINTDRIYLRGLGSNFPLAKTMINGRLSRLAEKNNRRVEIKFNNADKDGNLVILDDSPVVADELRDGKNDRYNEIVNDISYKILVSTVKQMYKGEVLNKYNHATIEKNSSQELYSYTVGLFDIYSQARKFKNQLVREGLSDAKIQVYLHGMLLAKEEIQMLKEEYPSLEEYIPVSYTHLTLPTTPYV